MLISAIPFIFVLLWALFATAFYTLRYGKQLGRNPWTLVAIFVVNMIFFGWSIILFVFLEWIRWNRKN